MKLELCTHTELPYGEIEVSGVNVYMSPTEFFILTDALKYYSKNSENDTYRLMAKKMLEDIRQWNME